MRQRVKMWGNSLSVRIPKILSEELKLYQGSEVEVSVKGSRLIIEPVAVPAYSLDQLLTGVTPANVHGETDWGPSVGKEVS
jgi:antitoxin MazE